MRGAPSSNAINIDPELGSQRTSKSAGSIGMWACCVAMLVPIGIYFASGGSLTSVTSAIGLLAPLALCGGMHFVMHRWLGRSCHGAAQGVPTAEPSRRRA